MTEEGILYRKRGKTCYVQLERTARCDTCKACLVSKNQRVVIPARAVIECKVGDRVIIELPKAKALYAPLVLYALPILFLLIGALLGSLISEMMSVLFSFLFLMVALLISITIDKLVIKSHPNAIATIVRLSQDKSAQPTQESLDDTSKEPQDDISKENQNAGKQQENSNGEE